MRAKQNKIKTAIKLKTCTLGLSSLLTITAASLPLPVFGQQEQRIDLQIEAQSLDAALKAFAKQAGKQIIFYSNDAKRLTATALEGNYTEAEALQAMLGDSGLLYVYLNDRTIAVGSSERISAKINEMKQDSSALEAPAEQPPDQQEERSQQATDSNGNVIEEITVVGRRYDQELSISAKRNANQLVDVLSASQASRLPDNNIAESLGRIAGVSFQRSGETGNGNFIAVRGLDSTFNNFQFDGVNSGLASGGTRRVPLDGITADDVAELRVVKALLPQDEGEGIGGSVQITTRTPLQRNRDRFNVSVEGRYGEFSEKFGSRSNLTFTKIFNENFGINLSLSHRKRFIHNFEVDATSSNLLSLPALTDADGNPVSTDLILDQLGDPGSSFDNVTGGFFPSDIITFEEQTYELQRQERETISISGAVDWQVSDSTRLTLGGRYSAQESLSTEDSIAFDMDDGDFELVDGTLFTEFGDPEIDFESQIEDDEDINASLFLKGETNLDRLKLNYQASYAVASSKTPQTDIDFDTGSLLDEDTVNFVPFSFVDRYFPIPNASVLNDPDFITAITDIENTQILDDFTTTPVDKRENKRYALKLDAEYEFDMELLGGTLNSVRAGVKYERSEVEEDEITYVDFDAGALNLDGTFNIDNDGTGDGASLSQFPGLFAGMESLSPIGSPLSGIGLNGIPTLNEQAFRQLIRTFNASFVASGETPSDISFFDATEDFYALYFQADIEFFEKLRLIGGVRVERYEATFASPLDVDVDIITANLTDPADESTSVTEVIDLTLPGIQETFSGATDNTEILPRLNAIFSLNDTVQLRAGIGYSIARPNYRQLGASTGINVIFEAEADEIGATPVLPGVGTAEEAVAAGGITLDQLTEADIIITSGNPNLENVESLNLDFSVGYYPSKGTSLTAGIFYKSLDNLFFFGAESASGIFDPELTRTLLSPAGQTLVDQLGGLDALVNSGVIDDVEIFQPRNGESGIIKGFEIGFNHQFTWAEGFWSKFGISANLTYTDSRAKFDVVEAATEFNPEGGLQDDEALIVLGFASEGDALVRETSLLGAPDWTLNNVLYYDDDLEIALSVRYQSEAFDAPDDFGLDQFNESYTQVDFDAEYKLPLPSKYGRVTVFLEIPDITDNGQRPTDLQRLGTGSGSAIFDEASFNGREFRLGLRAKF